jgi:tRNA1(Val) A37 N6-methylase TrmN6
MLLPYIKYNNVWECAGTEKSEIYKVLTNNGFNVITSHVKDNKSFFDYEPDNYDIIITNPPYSLKMIF